mgnify:CR=1 FL=1
MLATPLYDDFDDYDRFVNWPSRLAYELPFIEKQLASGRAPCAGYSMRHWHARPRAGAGGL